MQQDIGSHCREINHKIVGIMNDLIGKMIEKVHEMLTIVSACFTATHFSGKSSLQYLQSLSRQ